MHFVTDTITLHGWGLYLFGVANWFGGIASVRLIDRIYAKRLLGSE